jgi:hypothetical protein
LWEGRRGKLMGQAAGGMGCVVKRGVAEQIEQTNRPDCRSASDRLAQMQHIKHTNLPLGVVAVPWIAAAVQGGHTPRL